MPRTVPPWEIKREILTKQRTPPTQNMVTVPRERPAKEYIQYGTINLTNQLAKSHEVAAWVKKIMHLKVLGMEAPYPKVQAFYPSRWRTRRKWFSRFSTAAKNTFVL